MCIGSKIFFLETIMGRTKIEVDKSELIAAINKVESSSRFTTRNDLAIAVSKVLDVNVSPAVVLLRIKEFNIEPKTPKGKRGRQPGVKLSDEHKAAMQAGRSRTKEFLHEDCLRKYFPESRQDLVTRVVSGSLKAAIGAKCLDCTQFQVNEIKNCTVTSCPLWNFRPNKS